MRIGIVGPIWLNIPPTNYGGTEEVVYNLTEGLVDQGHQVTLFGPATAKVRARVVGTVEKPLRESDVEWTNVSYILYHLTEAFDRGEEFDLLHVHLNKSQDYFALPLAIFSKTPVVFTIHFMVPTQNYNRDRHLVLAKYSQLPFTSISDSQRNDLGLNFIKTVYNGIDLKSFPYSDKVDNYYAWLGKINPVKGTKEAILAAKKAGVKLLIMGVVDSGVPSMMEYYEKEVVPLIDGKQIVWVGEVGVKEKVEILGKARALLNPILWEEPFGLVMVESQAVGTPVISFRRGAAPEVIIEGKTGFLVDTLTEMVEKIKETDKIKRIDCRQNVEEKFTVSTMIKGYTEAYQNVIGNWSRYKDNQKARLLAQIRN